MNVVYHYRKQGCAFSMEQVFDDVRGALSPEVRQSAFYCPRRAASPKAIWENCRAARRHAGPVNHITGEVHYLALALPCKGLVLTIHDTGDTNAFTGWKQQVFRWLWYVAPVRRAAVVTFISNFAKQSVEKLVGFALPNARVIPDPVSPRFQFSPKPFPPARPRILCLGTKPNKNLERLAEALAGLDVELRIIGALKSEQQRKLSEHRIEYSVAERLSADEILAEYDVADIVSLISTFEGFGLPIVEGQAIGRPVITSSIEPMSETAGQGALLVDPLNAASIRAGFERLLGDAALRLRLVEAGRENVRRFQAVTIARQYEEVYRSVA